ncbi:BglG family transcription antiterminator [Bacillus chungangensis]|uniref:Transcriptional antiterminator/mannitol/fructose-specific phosphotransferase system IIA component (Ntr-type) n=1 Tax=Bacillus chungangensis TaxID=587633 RepID=A0ABT9WVL7_9BACI|nr:BglG family transcription antiterminator [Bacillus chungangensis]MDQ0177269.1 transcriptional antiterminator/mannitol/fructose-specific phosphotransferase system IIA component (Ntr-type) [Bacillus chungangensis]
MNNRARDLILFLMENDRFFTVKQLSEQFSVSQRTMYNDLIEIDEFLMKHDLASLTRQKGKGVFFYPKQSTKNKIKMLLDQAEFSFHTPEERKYRMLHFFLIRNNYVTIDQVSNFLKVSRNTVINDLKQIKDWLTSFNLSLISYPYKGLKIEGTELAIRKALLAVYREEQRHLLDIPSSESIILSEFLSEADINMLALIVSEAEHELQTIIADNSYFRVMLHLGMAIARVKQRRTLEKMPFITGIQETREYQAACKLKEKIDSYFNIDFPENEIGYFAAQLVSSSLQNTNQLGNINDQWLPLQMITRAFIQAVEKELNVPLMNDAQLFNGLLAHLRPAIYRIKNGTTIDNPVLDQIRDNYTLVHCAVMKTITIIEAELDIIFNEDETAFVTMYVTAALERQKKQSRRTPVAIIVCNTGTSTSQMLMTQLKKWFRIRLIGAFPARQANEIISRQPIDLVITTVPLELDDVEIITVNPVLSQEDLQNLTMVLERLDGPQLLVQDIMKLIEPYCTIHDPTALRNRLKEYFHPEDAMPKINERRANPVLIELLNENLIEVKADIQDRDTAVKRSGELLLKNGLIESEYVDAMVDNVHKNGNYIVIAPGIAMPHARPEYGVKDIGFSIVTLKEPIEFGHRLNDPVRIVIGFCAVDHQTHLTALSELVDILNQEEKIKAILEATTSKEVMNIIKEEEK